MWGTSRTGDNGMMGNGGMAVSGNGGKIFLSGCVVVLEGRTIRDFSSGRGSTILC